MNKVYSPESREFTFKYQGIESTITEYFKKEKMWEALDEFQDQEKYMAFRKQTLRIIDKNDFLQINRINQLHLPEKDKPKKYEKDFSNSFFLADWQTTQRYISFILEKRKYNLTDLTLRPTLCEIVFRPCRFYIDMDADINDLNRNTNWELGAKNVMNFALAYLKEYFVLKEGNQQSIYYLLLDSSSKEKFSRHALFYVYVDGKEVLFENNIIFKDFMKQSLFEITEKIESISKGDEEQIQVSIGNEKVIFYNEGRGIKNIFGKYEEIVKDKIQTKSLIDLSVYDYQRNMRIAINTKYNKERYLIIHECNHPQYTQLVKNEIEKYPKGVKPFYTCEMTPFERYKLLISLNQSFLYQMAVINSFPGWETLRVIRTLFDENYKKESDKNLGRRVKKVKPNEEEKSTDILCEIPFNKNYRNDMLSRKIDGKSLINPTQIDSVFCSIKEPLCRMENYKILFVNPLAKSEYDPHSMFFTFTIYRMHCMSLGDVHKHQNPVLMFCAKELKLYQLCFDEVCKSKIKQLGTNSKYSSNKYLVASLGEILNIKDLSLVRMNVSKFIECNMINQNIDEKQKLFFEKQLKKITTIF